MGQDSQTMMYAPAAKAQSREKIGPYLRFQGWASLHMPGFWRLRLEILAVGYVVLFVGAILVPLIFIGMSGPRDHSYECEEHRWEMAATAAQAAGKPLPRRESPGYGYFTPSEKEIVRASTVPCAGAVNASYYSPTYDAIAAPAEEYPAPAPAEAVTPPAEYPAPAASDAAAPPADYAAPADATAAPAEIPPAPAEYAPEYAPAQYYAWTGGFNAGEQILILTIFIFLSLIFALVWAFFVARGTRLRDVVSKTDAPGFMTCVLALTPLVFLPILAGHMAFAASHGDLINALFLGKAVVAQAGGQSMELHFPTSTYGGSFDILLVLFGAAIALILAAGLKIIMYDGVLGLLRTALMALLIAVPTITLAVFLYITMQYGETSVAAWASVLVLFAPLAVMWIFYQKDLFSGVRRRMTRPLALTFLVLWPMWFAWASIVAGAFLVQPMMDYSSSFWPVTWFFIIAFIIGVVIEAQLFRGVAKISLLPRP